MKKERHPPERKERAVRMVPGHGDGHPPQWAATCSVSGKLGAAAETLRARARQAETDAGQRPGLTPDGRERLRGSGRTAGSGGPTRP